MASIVSMRAPCDEAVLSGGDGPCAESAKPWILTATILGSSMAFIDSTVVNVALPAMQASFHATVVDVHMSMIKATAPPCKLPVALQSSGKTSSS